MLLFNKSAYHALHFLAAHNVQTFTRAQNAHPTLDLSYRMEDVFVQTISPAVLTAPMAKTVPNATKLTTSNRMPRDSANASKATG